MALILKVFGIVGLLGFTCVLATWAMAVNRYWSGAVVIQHDQVCEQGPYRYIRHPAYLGAIFQWIWPPLILGSWWALLPASLMSLGIFIRTSLEDQFLQEQLPGYVEYIRRVRFRLVPGIW